MTQLTTDRQIKFSHRYTKMPQDLSNSFLLDVWVKNLEDMSEGFLNYDTQYSGGWYPLPKKGKFLVLFIRTGYSIWTTIRRWIPRKEQYYRGLIGQEVKIVIQEDK
jgi:hypothetical protein